MTQEELKDIARCGETTTIQFKEQFTGQKEIAKEMIAFANTLGGQIFFGIKDKTGELVGLSYDEIQTINRELGNAANEHVRPTITSPPMWYAPKASISWYVLWHKVRTSLTKA